MISNFLGKLEDGVIELYYENTVIQSFATPSFWTNSYYDILGLAYTIINPIGPLHTWDQESAWSLSGSGGMPKNPTLHSALVSFSVADILFKDTV
jgi:hypothetical protein